jgi:hypothetical protein
MPRSMWCRVVLVAGSVAATTGCGSATDPPETGQIEVTVTTSGPEPDSNGYHVYLDGGDRRVLGADDSTAYEQVEPGSHGIELTSVAANCAVSEGATRSVTVAAGGTEHAAFQVACLATATLRVVTQTIGVPLDHDGYQILIPGRGTRPIGANESITMTGLRPGTLGMQLIGLAPGCGVPAGTLGRLVTLVAGDTAEVKYQVVCVPLSPEGSIVVTVRTQTVNAPTPSGYTLTLDGGRTTSVAATQSVTLAHVSAGVHSLKLSGMPSWCVAGSGGFPGSNPVQIRVVAGAVATVAFGVLCLG